MTRFRVAFLVNGTRESAAAFRARAFALHLKDEFEILVAYRTGAKLIAILQFLRFLHQSRPRVTYVVDMGFSGVLAGIAYKLLFGNRLVIDTGDAVYALARSMGRNRIGLGLTKVLEFCGLNFADRIVVRGTLHQKKLREQNLDSVVVQDGVELDLFRPTRVDCFRKQYGLENKVTIGLIGSITWNPRLGQCYGWELVEALAFLRDLPVTALIVGDGSGLTHLEARAHELSVHDRILFLGRIPYKELPPYLNAMDLCLSTQTNDLVGQVRTTGKLPLYLAAGRYILASRVGEASLVLPDEMLIEYRGSSDADYPRKLADRIRFVIEHGVSINRCSSRAIAEQHFDYSVLTQRLAAELRSFGENYRWPRSA